MKETLCGGELQRFTWSDNAEAGGPRLFVVSETVATLTCNLAQGPAQDTATLTGPLTNGNLYLLRLAHASGQYGADAACLTVASPSGQVLYDRCAAQYKGELALHFVPNPGAP